ncbi:nucleotide exchange factor GrpE [Arcobacter sp. FWKO B]|uniref:nucleotide exchange factor GrpE n=1 Tax=Arcobacter sp. FWKO B TaxID=2593672 RepID=UPI0018A5DA99|nr:nucleotide exchange factor GrpE [Arcobacter sp. FWKO B]QOG12488.1 nucleotide exchange factor GrpE [Arcobacter sp. FWKO B]
MSENKENLDNIEQTEAELQSEEVESQEGIVIDEVAILEAKLKEAEEKYLRVHADFENIKKRMEKDKIQAIEYASERFAKDLLNPIDSLEFAIASLDNSEADPTELLAKVKEGIELTIKSFKSAFEKHGIELVDVDSGFDPNLHDAVMHAESDNHDEGEIVQVLQKGYKYKERLLRPAMVSICKK